MNYSIAVLLTCHNRKEKTIACLKSLFQAFLPTSISLQVFMVDDGSTDGTAQAVQDQFPEIKIVTGNGNLFWAGGMRLAFQEAFEESNYDGFLLLNDDVELRQDFILNLFDTKEHCYKKYGKGGLYSGSTKDWESGKVSYGGNVLTNGMNCSVYKLVEPTHLPQPCHLTNANVLLIDREVVDTIGFFDEHFTHAFADYDFSFRAFKAGFPVYITPGICGYCIDDHGNNWSSSKKIRERISYLKSPTGLAYEDYMFYGKRHFPKQVPEMFIKLWVKTFFPSLWALKSKMSIL